MYSGKRRAIHFSVTEYGVIMTSRDFCYWLQGYFEIAGHNGVTETQSAVIQKHLALVFKHEIDPSFPDSKELDKIHNVQRPMYNPNATARC